MNLPRLKNLFKAWDRFLMEPISPVPIGVFRILFGFLVLANGLLFLPELQTWFGPQGVMSLETAARITPGIRVNLLQWMPSTESAVRIFFSTWLVSAFCLMVGLFTRIASIVVFVAICSLHNRNVLILHSGDTLMRVLSFFLIFAPAGAALSVDRLIALFKGRASPKHRLYSPWAQRLIQIQLSVLYLSTFLWKVQGNAWLDGVATYYTSRLKEFERFPVFGLFDHAWFIQLTTWGTLLVEFSMGVLVWFAELRYAVLISGVFLHLGIEYSMNIPLFEWITLSAYACFIDADVYRKAKLKFRLALRRWLEKPTAFYYDGDCEFCVRSTHVILAMDFFKLLEPVDFRRFPPQNLGFESERAEKELLVRTPEGKWLGGYDAFRWISHRLPLTCLASWILYLPGIPFLGRRAYAWVANHRTCLIQRKPA